MNGTATSIEQAAPRHSVAAAGANAFRPSAAGTLRDLNAGIDLERDAWFFRSRQEALRLFEAGVRPLLNEPLPFSYVDFGGGQGFLAATLRDELEALGYRVRATVVDANAGYLAQAEQRGLQVVLANLEACCFDAVQLITMRLVNHYDDYRQQREIVKAAYRSLAPGGVIVNQIEAGSAARCRMMTELAGLPSLGGAGTGRCAWVTVAEYSGFLREAGFQNIHSPDGGPTFEMTLEDALDAAWHRFNAREASEREDGALKHRFLSEARARLAWFEERYGAHELGLVRRGTSLSIQYNYPIIVGTKQEGDRA